MIYVTLSVCIGWDTNISPANRVRTEACFDIFSFFIKGVLNVNNVSHQTRIAEVINDQRLSFRNHSLLYNALKEDVLATVHIAIGTDIVHQHPSFDAGAAGEASLKDFHRLIEEIAALGDGGVVLNIGSSVILPEVFLKAINVARNLGYKVKDFTACNFDMMHHYRPYQNVVTRPVRSGGKGYNIIGHHEIMLPLLGQAVIEKIKET